MTDEEKVARYDYAIYMINELIECDKETIKELHEGKVKSQNSIIFLKGRIDGYKSALDDLGYEYVGR